MNDYTNCTNGVIKTNKNHNNTIYSNKAEPKSLMKTFFSRNNNNNTKSVDEMDAKKDNQGRKTFVFWTLICLLMFLALGNLILTFTILGVLRLGYGMNSLELIPEAVAIKFYGNTDLGHVYKIDGKINGFLDRPVDIEGEDNGSLYFNLVGRSGRPMHKLTMDRNGTTIHNTNIFTIRGANDNRNTLSSRNPHFNLQSNVNKLKVKLIRSNRLVSLNNSSMEIKSDSSINLRGTEGTRMESSQVVWSADQDIILKSVNGSIVLNGLKGVSIDTKNIPISNYADSNTIVTQFKLCVCVPQGKLFKLPVLQGQSKVSCSHIKLTSNFNPCI